MRGVITVSPDGLDGWSVPIQSVVPERRWSRRMLRGGAEEADQFPMRDPKTIPQEPAISDLSTADPCAIRAVYDRVASRNPMEGELLRYGRYLFDILIGQEIWRDITAE